MLASVTRSLAAAAAPPTAPGEPSAAARTAALRTAGANLAAAAAALAAVAGSGRATPRAPRRTAGVSAAGYAAAAASSKAATPRKGSTAASGAKPGPLDFLDDRRLSVEEKLLKLLAHLNERWNKELDEKLKEFRNKGAKESGPSAGGAGSSGGRGLLGKAIGLARTVFPQVGVSLEVLQNPAARAILSKFAGPALAAVATATGFPALAPVALKYGPELVDAAAGLATSIDEGGAGRGKGASGGAAKPDTATALGSDRDDQLKLMEIQRIRDQQKEMFSLVSNLLRTGHETRMAVIQNVR